MPLERGRPGFLCQGRHTFKGTLIASICTYQVIKSRFTDDALCHISSVGTHGGGVASFFFAFCAMYVCWSLSLMSEVPPAAKAFGSASPRPLRVARDTRDKAFKVFICTLCKHTVQGRVFRLMLLWGAAPVWGLSW